MANGFERNGLIGICRGIEVFPAGC